MLQLIDILTALTKTEDVKIGVDGTFVGQFNVNDIPYRYIYLYVKCIYPIWNGSKKYIGLDLLTKQIIPDALTLKEES